MKKYQYIIFILSFIFNCLSYGQNTWSKEYDLGEGRKNFLRNIIVDQNNSRILLSSWQFCPTEIPNINLECSIISNYNKNGNLISEVVYDSTAGVENGNTFFFDGEINHISILNTDSLGKYYQLLKMDTSLYEKSIEKISFGNDSYCILSGMILINEENYIYGTLINYSNNDSEAFFAKLDDSLNVKIINRYPARQLNVEMNDLQATPDGNLAFILKHKGPAGPTSNPGFEIYKVDHQGVVLDSFVFNEGFGLDWPFNLTIDEDGNYYFYSDKHPIEGFPPSIGRMNKLNKDMMTLEWSVILPNGTFGRNYRIEESLLAQKGDIIICGSMQDFLTFENSPDHVHTGFITRFDQEGNIVWHHIYKVPNDEFLPQSEYGRYRFSRLTKIVELEDGSLLAGGNHAYHWTVYNHPDFDDTKETNLLWLLKVDADGCIEGEECGEVIVLDQQIIHEAPIFTFGTKWTYDFESNDLGPYVKSYINYEITDTFWRNDSLIYLITNNRNLPHIEMVQDHKRIYLLDPMTNRWQLSYDFYAYNSYRTEYFDPFSNEIDSTTLDLNTGPFILVDMRERGLVRRQEVTALENGTSSEPLRYDIAEGVGKLSGGLSLELGLGLSNLPYTIGKIRCFEQGDFAINFTDALPSDEYLACDSVRYTSSVKDEDYSTVTISPNPFSEQFNITLEGRDNMIGRLVNSSGQVVRMVEIKTSEVLDGLEHLASGFYAFVLSDQQGNVLQVKKMIKE